jgi:CheY-like chemotaxis protein
VQFFDGMAKHVVVVDDDRATLALYRDLLGEEGYRATLLVSPDLEPAAIAALAPDLLLLDLRFGHERCGVDLLRQLKGDPATLGIPVLVCSADARLLDELGEQLAAWDCAVLAKPFGLEELLAAIAGCLAPGSRAALPGEWAMTRGA